MSSNNTLDSLGLSARPANALRGWGVTTVDQLTRFSDRDLLRMPWLGRVGLREIEEALRVRGLKLRPTICPTCGR